MATVVRCPKCGATEQQESHGHDNELVVEQQVGTSEIEATHVATNYRYRCQKCGHLYLLQVLDGAPSPQAAP